MRVSMVLADKKDSKKIYSIKKTATLKEVAKSLCDKHVGALLVIENDDDPDSVVGIISERDVISECAEDKCNLDKEVHELMSKNLIVVESTSLVNEAMNIMAKHRVRHVPVMDGKKLVGMLSIGDVLKSMLEDQEIKIRHFNDHRGTYGNKVY